VPSLTYGSVPLLLLPAANQARPPKSRNSRGELLV
jgi:hypothetical protein